MPQKPKRSNKRNNKLKKTRKQNIYIMRGCSKNSKLCKTKSRKNNKSSLTLGNKDCPNCGTNCHCGPNCNCPPSCKGSCYLNRQQKGGANGCGSCGCPISLMSLKEMKMVGGQNGGSCNACVQNGGNFFKSIGSIPGPIVGSSWGSSVNKWPGVDGIGANRNVLKPYNTLKDPQLQMSMYDSGYNTLNSKVGGKKRYVKGGGLVPQDLVNLGNNFSFNLKSAYNSLNGYKAPIDPLPYKDQLTQNTKFVF